MEFGSEDSGTGQITQLTEVEDVVEAGDYIAVTLFSPETIIAGTNGASLNAKSVAVFQ